MIETSNTINELHFLSPLATIQAITDAAQGFDNPAVKTIIVPPLLVKAASGVWAEKGIAVATIIGFPYGYNAIESKLSDIILAIVDGATEVLVALNITALKNDDWQYLAKELNVLMQVVNGQSCKLGIAADVQLLNSDQLTKCCDLYGLAGISTFTVNTDPAALPPSNTVLQQMRQQLAEAIPLRLLAPSNSSHADFYSSAISLFCSAMPVK
jgi:deoxyribose-phosphate aldolase